MLKLFKEDAARWIVPQQVAPLSEVTLKRVLKLLYLYIPLRAMLAFRIGTWLIAKRVPFFKGILYRHLFHHYGLELAVDTEIGGGFYIAHPAGSVISPKRMGKNCTIVHNVTIGMRNEWEFPEIGDNVFIGAGARVLGGIRIGDNAVIGANAVVIHDVPDGATVVGIPAKVIKM